MDTSTAATTTRGPPCFFNKNGLASLADQHHHSHSPLINSRPLYLRRRTSLKNFSSMMSSPRSDFGRRLYDARFEDPQPHFLDACFLCKKPLDHNRDIFMYRGDIPFCSEECRLEQIEMDEAKENKLKLSTLRKKDQRMPTSPNKTQNYPFSRGTVAAA